MGTNGSFDIATITDLFLLEMIYKEDYQIDISVSTFNKVGDDLWCYDPSDIVLNTYTNMCGIDINVQKTKFATQENLCGEFVSRSINRGVDVSRISANICRAVRKNILDLPQLAYHLEERGCNFILPLREIFHNSKIKEDRLRGYLRTFYVLCDLYPRSGLNLLKKSLHEEFSDDIYGDEVISIVKTYGISVIKDSFYSYLVLQLLNSIADKSGRIFDSAAEFDSSEVLLQRNDPSI
jgi:hypothetical protein